MGPGMWDREPSAEWISACLRRAGIAQRLPVGRGGLSSEPVLVTVRSGFRRSDIYDQDGNLVGQCGPRQRDSGSRVVRTLSTVLADLDVLDRDGNAVSTLAFDQIVNPRWLIATRPDGGTVGEIRLRRRRKGSVRADGKVVGRVGERRGGLRWVGAVLFGVGNSVFQMYDSRHKPVGRIIRLGLGHGVGCNVVVLDARAPDRWRELAIAASHAIDLWCQPKGGGG